MHFRQAFGPWGLGGILLFSTAWRMGISQKIGIGWRRLPMFTSLLFRFLLRHRWLVFAIWSLVTFLHSAALRRTLRTSRRRLPVRKRC